MSKLSRDDITVAKIAANPNPMRGEGNSSFISTNIVFSERPTEIVAAATSHKKTISIEKRSKNGIERKKDFLATVSSSAEKILCRYVVFPKKTNHQIKILPTVRLTPPKANRSKCPIGSCHTNADIPPTCSYPKTAKRVNIISIIRNWMKSVIISTLRPPNAV